MSDIQVAAWLKSLPLAPEYHPTEAEFTDPVAYIFKIEAEARQYGICKIIPPFVKASKRTVIATLNRSLAQSTDAIPAGLHGSVSGIGRSMTGSTDLSQVDSMTCAMLDSNICNADQKAKFTTRRQQLGCNSKRSRGQTQNLAQKLVWQSGESYTLEQFEAKAKQFARSRLGTSKELSPLSIETLFWRAANDKPITIEYGNDIPGSAFPKPNMDAIFSPKSRSWCKKREREFSCRVHSDESSVQRDNVKSDMYERGDGGEGASSVLQPKLVQRKEGIGLIDDEKDSKRQCPKIFETVPDSGNVKGMHPKLVGPNSRGIEGEGTRSRATGTDTGADKVGAGWKLANSAWNMQTVARSSCSLLRHMPEEVPGVTSPMVYIGMLFSWFAWHVEDHELHSLNYLHMGGSKTWYAVPGDIAPALEEVVQVHGYGSQLNQPAAFVLLGEKTTVMSPQVLIDAGVPCCRLVQNAGEFVVTFPRSYHLGFSHGFNCGEAVNFATPGWLEVAKEAAVRRAAMNYLPMVSHQQLLYLAALSFPTRHLMYLPSEPRSSRLRDKKRSCGEEFIKTVFVNDVHQNNQLLGLLLEMGATCCLWKRDVTDSSSGRTHTSDAYDFSRITCSTEAEGKVKHSKSQTCHHECWNVLETDQQSFSNGLSNASVRLSDELLACNGNASKLQGAAKSVQSLSDSMATTFDLEWGTLPCAACGVLCFASVAVVQPTYTDVETLGPRPPNRNNLPAYCQSNSAVKSECELPTDVSHMSDIFDLPSACTWPLGDTLENRQDKTLVDNFNGEIFSSELQVGNPVSTKHLLVKGILQPCLVTKRMYEPVSKVVDYGGYERPDLMVSTSALSNYSLECSKQLHCSGNAEEIGLGTCGDEFADQMSHKEDIPSFEESGDTLIERSCIMAEPFEKPSIKMVSEIDGRHIRNVESSCMISDSLSGTIMGRGTEGHGQHSKNQKHSSFVAVQQNMVSNACATRNSSCGHLSGSIIEHSIAAERSDELLISPSKTCGSTNVLLNVEFEGSGSNAAGCPALSALELLAAAYDDSSEPDDDDDDVAAGGDSSDGGCAVKDGGDFSLDLFHDTVFPSKLVNDAGFTVDAPWLHVGGELILGDSNQFASKRECSSLESNVIKPFPLKCLDEDCICPEALKQSIDGASEFKERHLVIQCSNSSKFQVPHYPQMSDSTSDKEPATITNLEDTVQLLKQPWEEVLGHPTLGTSSEAKLSLTNQTSEILMVSQQSQVEKHVSNAEGSESIYEGDIKAVTKESFYFDIKANRCDSVKDLPEGMPAPWKVIENDSISESPGMAVSNDRITSMQGTPTFVSCRNVTRPRLLCLEHALEAWHLLLQLGGCNVLIVCHPKIVSIEKQAKHLASELSIKHEWRNILLQNATHREQRIVQMAVDVAKDGEQGVTDWVAKLGMSVHSFRDKDKMAIPNSYRMLPEVLNLGSEHDAFPVAGRELCAYSWTAGCSPDALLSIGKARNHTKGSKQKKVLVAGHWCGRVWMSNKVHPSLVGSHSHRLSLPSIHPLTSSFTMAVNKQVCSTQRHSQKQPIQHSKGKHFCEVRVTKLFGKPSFEEGKEEEEIRESNINQVDVATYCDNIVGSIEKRGGKKRKDLEVGKSLTELEDFSVGKMKKKWIELDPVACTESITDTMRLPCEDLGMQQPCGNLVSNTSCVQTDDLLSTELDCMNDTVESIAFPAKISPDSGNFGKVGLSSTGNCIDGVNMSFTKEMELCVWKDGLIASTSARCSVAPMTTCSADQVLVQPFDQRFNPSNINHEMTTGLEDKNIGHAVSGCMGILQRRDCSKFESQAAGGSNVHALKKIQKLTSVNELEVGSVNSELTRIPPSQIDVARSYIGRNSPGMSEGKLVDNFDENNQMLLGQLVCPKENFSQQSSKQPTSLQRKSDSSSDSHQWRLQNSHDIECPFSASPGRPSGKTRSKRQKRRSGVRILPNTHMQGADNVDVDTAHKESTSDSEDGSVVKAWQKQVESDGQSQYNTRLSAGGPSTRLRAKSTVKPNTIEGKKNGEETEPISLAKTREELGKETKKMLKLQKAANKNEAIKDPKQEEAYPCDIDGCNMTFPTSVELSMHKRNMCTVTGCGKDFGSHKYLLQHRRVHMDDRPLKCTWKGCKMTFKWAWARTEHFRVHTGERPYKCTVPGCDQTFRFVSDFSRHKRNTGHMKS